MLSFFTYVKTSILKRQSQLLYYCHGQGDSCTGLSWDRKMILAGGFKTPTTAVPDPDKVRTMILRVCSRAWSLPFHGALRNDDGGIGANRERRIATRKHYHSVRRGFPS